MPDDIILEVDALPQIELEVAETEGTAIDVDTMAKGDPGKSAYQTAVENGFVGTEPEWLASLVGPQGPQGSTDWDDITNKPTIPSKTSDLTNDSGFLASESDPVFVASAAYGITSSDISAWNAKSEFSGSYNDLSDKPTIPSAVTESTVSGWGFTKNTGTYSKPSGGIPKTDLASAVQTSLGKADTALQSYTETDPVFSASAAHGITSADVTSWNNKGTYSKPSGGIPKTDLASAVQTSLGKADSALQSYTEIDPVFIASAAHGISSTDITNWNNKSDFSGSYDDLTNKPTIPTVPTKLSDFTDDLGSSPTHTHSQYLTAYTETDPTVPSWAKASSKPSYTKSEVGLGNVDNVQQYSASNPPPYPVTSVNGSTGAITGLQTTGNLVTSLSSSSTNSQYPSAKCVYDLAGNIETLLASI